MSARRATRLAILCSLLLACGGRSAPSKADTGADGKDSVEQEDEQPPEAVQKLPTALPEARPSPFEAEYHVGTPDSDDLVSVKLSEKGASTSLGDREHRIVITYDVPATELDRVYAAMRAAAFDRIETAPSRDVQPGGTSIRLVAGTVRRSVADFGNVYPEDAWTTEYDAASKALESHLPSPPKGAKATIDVRWDASMKGHRATVALALGPDFAGVTRLQGTTADVRIGLLPPTGDAKKKWVATLRSGPPATSVDVELDLAVHAGIEVRFDAETSRPVARAFAAGDTKAASPAEPGDAKAPAPAAPPR